MRFYIAVALWLTLMPIARGGGTDPQAMQALQERIAPLTSLAAGFHQTVYSADDYPVQETEGRLTVARPGKIRWISDAPFEQWVIADGETLWIYDPDLEQVSIRPFLRDISHTPAILFIGEVDGLADNFRVQVTDTEQGQLYTLTPVEDQQLYRQLQLQFTDNLPVAMTLWDSLGQRTEISLRDVEINQSPDPALFQFVPPAGVDVLRDD